MIQTQDLQILYNTMTGIETKGDSTKVMADCLRFIERKIQESQQEPVAPPVPPMPMPAPEPVPMPEPVSKPRKKRKSEPVDMPSEPVVDAVEPDQAAE